MPKKSILKSLICKDRHIVNKTRPKDNILYLHNCVLNVFKNLSELFTTYSDVSERYIVSGVVAP